MEALEKQLGHAGQGFMPGARGLVKSERLLVPTNARNCLKWRGQAGPSWAQGRHTDSGNCVQDFCPYLGTVKLWSLGAISL